MKNRNLMKIDFKNSGSNHIVLAKKEGHYTWHYNTIDHWIMEYWASYIGVENDIENAYYEFMKTCEVSSGKLQKSIVSYLSENYVTYMNNLTPSFYIDFDNKIFISDFYDLVIEDRLIEGWTGYFKKFLDLIPTDYQYWMQNNENLFLSKTFLNPSNFLTAFDPGEDLISFVMSSNTGYWYVLPRYYWSMNYWSQIGIPKNIPQQEQEKKFLESVDFFKMENDFLRQVYLELNQGDDELKKQHFIPKIYADFDKKLFYSLREEPSFEKSLNQGWVEEKINFIKMIPPDYVFWT